MSHDAPRPRIYLSPPHLDGRERELMMEAFDSNWITTLGPQVDLFEKEICEMLNIRSAVALSSGTAALHLSLLLLGVQPGDEVMCSDLTFAATVNAVKYCGANPVLIDSDRATWNIDPNLVEEELRNLTVRGKAKPKAVISVDLYGQCADYSTLLRICEEYEVPLIEDAAEALGSDIDGKMAGTFGLMGVLSFNGNKIITTSGGGMLVSKNERLMEWARRLASQAREPVVHYEHAQVGYNYRLSNILAAIGRGQLENIDRKVEKKRAINRVYREELSGIDGLEFMPHAAYGRSNCWLTVILIEPDEFGAGREEIRLALESENIESRPVWKPMHLQPVYRDCRVRGGGVGEMIFEKGLCLPSGDHLDEDDLKRICGTIRSCRR